MMRLRLEAVALLLLTLLAPSAAFGCEITLRLAHQAGNTTLATVIQDKASDIEESTASKLCLDVHLDFNLGLHGFEAIRGVQDGIVDLVAVHWEYTKPLAPTAMFFGFPFAYETYDDVTGYWDEQLADALATEIKDHGVRVLGLWHLGFSDIRANESISLPGDLEGLSMQSVRPGFFHDALIDNGTQIIGGEQPGASNAEEVDLYQPKVSILPEIYTNLTLTRHRYAGLVVLGANDSLDSLDPETSQVLLELVAEIAAASSEVAKSRDEMTLQKLGSAGSNLRKLEPIERAQWVQKFGICPNCDVTGETCSKTGCPCSGNSCTKVGDKYCCTATSMPPPPGYSSQTQ